MNITSYCGLDCGKCEFTESHGCKGCIATVGKPFHGSCCVAECARARGVPFCGECMDFPCRLLESFSADPQYGDDPPGARVENCRRLKEALKNAL